MRFYAFAFYVRPFSSPEPVVSWSRGATNEVEWLWEREYEVFLVLANTRLN